MCSLSFSLHPVLLAHSIFIPITVRVFSGTFHRMCCYQLTTYSGSAVPLGETGRLGCTACMPMPCSPGGPLSLLPRLLTSLVTPHTANRGFTNRKEALFKYKRINRAWYLMSVIPALRRPQKEDHHDFKVNLGYYIERYYFKYNICVYVCVGRV